MESPWTRSSAENSDARDSESFFACAPAVGLPKGGGAIRGIGEKFAANPVTGTGSMSVPIITSPGRSGFGPQLSLSYDSGTGNGPFGFGWRLSLPAITRKTEKGLPRYFDAEESDVFILSGAEDLVPVFRQDASGAWVGDDSGNPLAHEDEIDGYFVRRYRPRVEGPFARVERWALRTDPREVHWRSISKDNILSIYGGDAGSRIADPEDARRIFSWLICETRDDKGNGVLYRYKAEDGAGIDPGKASEHNRGEPKDLRRSANRYLKRIYYGNRTPLLDGIGQRPRFLDPAQIDAQIANADWMFETVFDYGEHGLAVPLPNDAGDWSYRFDPFSSYRASFEIRTTRHCRRVLMFHHFLDETGVGRDCLVRSTDFTYSDQQDPADVSNPIYIFLLAVAQSGYRRNNGGYDRRSLPPVEFDYAKPTVEDAVHDVDADSLENLPSGIDGVAYQWTDLHGEGIPGILTEQAGAWFYKRNLGPLSDGGAEFGPLERVALQPNLALAGGAAQFMDLAGDGEPDLVVLDGPLSGFYEHDAAEGWKPFRPFAARLERDMRDPNLKFVDLDGDGHADVLISEDEALVWHASLAEEGFGPAQRVAEALDEEKGPRIVFADGTQSIYLADLSGDGLTDLVRIRNGEVCYWPNLGYGRFGAKVAMDNAPRFDHPEQFDHRRIRLADIDGSGTTDIIYLHRDGARLYFNQSGNGWSAPRTLSVAPRVDDLAAILPMDLLGNGTACLVWSSPLPGEARRQMRYVDLMGGRKPHLLIRVVNNLGAETEVQYAPSTKFYLQDKRDGTPWVTRLPFPVHVVERVVVSDAIGQSRFVTDYSYHHGFYDGNEREFRGFGRVDQRDTAEFAALAAGGVLGPASNLDPASHVPPALTRSWFHTGALLEGGKISKQFDHEYYREGDASDAEPGLDDAAQAALLLDDSALPSEILFQNGDRTPYEPNFAEAREAVRALKGAMLRQEVYAIDGGDQADRPYLVSERNYGIELLQPAAGNPYAVFFAHPREQVDFHYERKLVPVAGTVRADPRVGHSMTLAVDAFGNILRSLSIAYRRRDLPGVDVPEQKQTHLVLAVGRFANRADEVDWQHLGLPVETRSFEVVKPPEPGITDTRIDLFRLPEMAALTAGLFPPGLDEPPAAGLWPSEHWDWRRDPTQAPASTRLRLIEHQRSLYRRDDLGGALALGFIESMALPFENHRLAMTLALAERAYVASGKLTPAALDALLVGEGGYVHSAGDANWWVPSGRVFYSPGGGDTAAQELAHARLHFFLPHRYRDPFHTVSAPTESTATYDTHKLLMTASHDALGNATGALHDYRVLSARLLIDPNGNRSQAAFDILGQVVATAVGGKPGEALGDLLEGFDPDPPLPVLQAFAADPLAQAAALLGKATTRMVYDPDRYRRCGQSPFSASLGRETHWHDAGGTTTRIQIGFSFSDGFGREVQKKIQAEPGSAPQRAPQQILPGGDPLPGELLRGPGGHLIWGDTPQRWIGSGRIVFNNKGQPVRQYEPFFSTTPLREEEREMTDTGVSPILFYDPVGRLVATAHPNHTWMKTVFDPWQQLVYDASDSVMLDPAADIDVKDFFQRLPPADYLPSWYDARKSGLLGPDEQAAATKAAKCADTPNLSLGDSLGRICATVEHNRFERGGATIDERYPSRLIMDINGNQREVRDAIVQAGDALGRVVVRGDFDLLGGRLHQARMEAGERWLLTDVSGKLIRSWDSRQFVRRMTYDRLRRPTGLFVTEGGVERLAERTLYGEGQGAAANHKARVFQTFDAAGRAIHEAYDFKGNLLRSKRELLTDYRTAVDWQTHPVPSDGSFVNQATYDAFNRVTTATTPDGSVYRPAYNQANLLETVTVRLRGAAAATPFVDNIDYNARGQRILVHYANGAQTTSSYDPQTFRLTGLKTTRPTGGNGLAAQIFKNPAVVQDLRYTYDPTGNITRLADEALTAITFDGQQVLPICDYLYDASYRLIEAAGREHIGQAAFANSPNGGYRDHPFAGLGAGAANLQALRKYTQQYEYDGVGNLQKLKHQVGPASWLRQYTYAEVSQTEAAKTSNRLSASSVDPSPQTFAYDAHGNMAHMPHLSLMTWDFKDQLQSSARQVVNAGAPETTYYVYDAAGQRVRKVTHRQNGTRMAERIYIGNFEIYREFDGGGAAVALERETLQVMDDLQRIALVETQTAGAGAAIAAPTSLRRLQLGNHLASSSLELDQDAGLISYEEYHPYGTSAFQAMNGAAEVSLKRYRYTGMERDEETGLAYHGARYYAPWLGRWTACDPKGIESKLGLYGYGGSNPIMLLDRNGQQDIPSNASPDCAAASHHRGNPFGAGARRGESPGDVLLRRWNGLRQSVTRGVIWGMSLGYTPEELEKNYKKGTGEEFGQVPPTITLPIVDATPEVSGDLWLQFAGGLKSPTAPRGIPHFEMEPPKAPKVDVKVPKVEPKPTVPKEPVPTAEPPAKAAPAETPATAEPVEPAPKAPEPTQPSAPMQGPVQGGRGVWAEGNGVRGRAIEQSLANKLPGTKFYKNFPNFDRAVYSGAGPSAAALEVGQLKSLDFTAKTYATRGGTIYRQLMKDAGELGGVGESLWEHGGHSVEIGPATRRVLDVAVPLEQMTAAQAAEFSSAITDAASIGVEIKLHPLQ